MMRFNSVKELYSAYLELEKELSEKNKKLMSIIGYDKNFITDMLRLLKEHDRFIEEKTLYAVLCKLYFQDYNRQCDYDKMSGAEIVKLQHKVLQEIEEMFDYNFSSDFLN